MVDDGTNLQLGEHLHCYTNTQHSKLKDPVQPNQEFPNTKGVTMNQSMACQLQPEWHQLWWLSTQGGCV